MARFTPSSRPPPAQTHFETEATPSTPLLFNSSDVSCDPSAYYTTPPALDGDVRSACGRASYCSGTPGIEAAHIYSRNFNISLTVENAGSVARDHLASERTFLAYVRTSLTIAFAGVALAQLLTVSERLENRMLVPIKPFEIYARPLAAASVVLGLYVLVVGVSRYFAIQAALTQGLFPVIRFRIGFIALALAGIVTLVFGLLIAERTSTK
ncbi:hypothetical protein B0H11DRAFT_2231989 [Mycena galericulata]|nr:hypothetical protein B0H11DRAFT_2231989 [Mycena galericulata]